jgi:hypothetical protein
MEKRTIVNILFTSSCYFGNRKSGFPCFSSWIFPTIQFHASLSNLPPAPRAGGLVFNPALSAFLFGNAARTPPLFLKIASGEFTPPVTVCRVSRLTVMEVTRNVPPLQVRQVEAYEKMRAAAGKPAERPSAVSARLLLIESAQPTLQITRA